MKNVIIGVIIGALLAPVLHAAVKQVQITVYYDDANSAVGYARDGAALQRTYFDAAQNQEAKGPFTVKQLVRLAAQNEFVRLREIGKHAKVTHNDPDNSNTLPQ